MEIRLKFILLLSYMAVGGGAVAQVYSADEPLAHTYSIVAWDANTGEMAVGVQSHWFAVGTAVSWGEAGVGVVATQSFVNKSFGTEGLTLLSNGKSPEEALSQLIDKDEGRDYRQVAILDSKGRVAVYTGAKCIQYAGHQKGQGYSVQANMMLSKEVWPAMAKAFEENIKLPLAERVLKTMEAAETKGGDIRGKQSAALLVVGGKVPKHQWEEPKVDLRVDDHENPLQELRRLLKVYRAYEHMNKGDMAIEKNDMLQALTEYNSAQRMFPDNLEMKYWTAVSLTNNGKLKEALPTFKRVFEKDSKWRELTKRLVPVGILEVNEEQLELILGL